MISSADNEVFRSTTLRTAERALQFLETVAAAPKPPKLKDVAAAMGLNITTGYHMLNTLQAAGYIHRNSDGGLRVGGRVALLYQGMLRQQSIGVDLQPVVAELSSETRETSYLSLRSNDALAVQIVVEATQAVRVTGLHVGFSGSEHVRASGKAALAFLDETDRARMLDKSLTAVPPGQKSRILKALIKEFDVIRARGWALDDEGFEDGVSCVAAPFFYADGLVAGSLGVSLPASRFQQAAERVTEAVCAAAAQASSLLGYQQPESPTRLAN